MKFETVALLSALQISLVQAHKAARHAHFKRQDTATTAPPPLDTSTDIPPLASISLGMPTKVPPTFTATFAGGATGPISGAPPLPTLGPIALSAWPTQDRIPPVDSPQVREWMKELEGFHIPDLRPTLDSTCGGDPEAAADAANRGWWTCGGHTRSTDIVACPNKLDWGLSFDDGPSPYTPNLLEKLKEKDVQATFFVVGSRVIERPNMLIQEYMDGHEISIHTWSHNALTTLTNEQIVAELGWTRLAIQTVLGVTPITMRPPKGDIDDRVRAISLAMGLIPILWTSTPDGGKFDSFDWRVAGGEIEGPESVAAFETIMANGTNFPTGFITLQHDLFEITVNLAVGYTLDMAINHEPKFDLQPVGECMGLGDGGVYRETTKNTTFPYRNNTGLDVNGDGTPDVLVNTGTGTGAGFTITVPFWSSLTVVALATVSLFL
ncbi:hypothetical protein NLJ89_g4884 [Agrocybe chaxingu]|uniref:chitin deacetylase n=1 Tax=Agrocybe chaxingu TaxID=84603 RepID=A0A9W8K934_9AGAR|nr:hypothetical protein NLJ89_g4884 [Agrocybe chaxingu]